MSAAPPSKTFIQCLQPFIDRNLLSGVVTLVADKNHALSIESLGLADLAAQKPMRPDSLFWIASTTKPMTATLLMMLVDEGKVNIDDPVEKYLPIFKGITLTAYADDNVTLLKKPSRLITVKDLLSHTSGLPFKSRIEGPAFDVMPLNESVLSYALTSLQHEPGSKYMYANTGTNTVGRIIEVVSGIPYAQFLQSHLLDPLGMEETTFVPSESQVSRLAKSYKTGEDGKSLVEEPLGQLSYPLARGDRHGFPAGGLFSTAADVVRFGQMILNNGMFEGKRYITPKSVRMMTTTHTGDLNKWRAEPGCGYGLCFLTTTPDTIALGSAADATTGMLGAAGHGGALGNNLWIDPARGWVLVLMMQNAVSGQARAEVQKAFQDAVEGK